MFLSELEIYMDRASKRVVMDVLKGNITYSESQTALRDIKSYMLAKTMVGDKRNYRWWGRIKTARMTLAFCWS